MGLAESILASAKFRVEKLHVPEWGMDVWVRELKASERDRFEGEQAINRGTLKLYQNFRARFLVLTVCDESGARAFADNQVEAIGSLPAAGVDRVFDAAAKLNRIGPKDIEDLEKNSEDNPPGA